MRHNESYYDHWYGDLGLIYKINGVLGEQGSTIEFTVPEDYTITQNYFIPVRTIH